MDLILFLSGAAVAILGSILLSKRRPNRVSEDGQNSAIAVAKTSDDKLENLTDVLNLLPIGVVIVDTDNGQCFKK